MSNLRNKKEDSLKSRPLTPWWTGLPIGVGCICFILTVGYIMYFLPNAKYLIVTSVMALVAEIAWCKNRWIQKEILAGKAVELLKLSNTNSLISAEDAMRTTLADVTFSPQVKAAFSNSVWRKTSNNDNALQWEIPLPSQWLEGVSGGCLLSLLYAAKPLFAECEKATVHNSCLLINIRTTENVVKIAIQWEDNFCKYMGISPRLPVLKIESFTRFAVENETVGKEEPNKSWSEKTKILPENIEVTINYDGFLYTIITNDGKYQQAREYTNWLDLWSTWHSFEEIDALLCKHKVI